MIRMEMPVVVFGAMCAAACLSGCASIDTTTTTNASSAAAASTESVAVNVSTVTTAAMSSTNPPQQPAPTVDVLSDVKKPCGTVAADAPKFVDPETAN